MLRAGRGIGAALCAAVLTLGAVAAPAMAATAPDDPVFLFHNAGAEGSEGPVPPGSFEGLCGLAVDITGSIYVSDYHHQAVDILSPERDYTTQLTNVDPLDGPCGIAVDTSGELYVNDFHRNVTRYTPSVFPLGSTATFDGGVEVDTDDPTGVAVNLQTGDVYVNDRDHLAVYDSSGSFLRDIASGSSLEDGYGVAVSGYPGTEGWVYVPDAATDTVEIYDPVVSLENPVAPLGGPPGGFHSLVDSAVAIDRATGEVYVADRVGSPLSHHPEAAVDVFGPGGSYEGRLKYNVIDGRPVGLAVDNSSGPNQGRVYVTTGNSDLAADTGLSGIYGYAPGAASTVELPAAFSLSVSSRGGGGAIVSRAIGLDCSATCSHDVLAGDSVLLRAQPDPGSTFLGWSGAGCAGAGSCRVTMDGEASVSAEFSAPAPGAAPASPSASAAAAPAPMQASTTAVPAARRHRVARHHHRARHHRGARRGEGGRHRHGARHRHGHPRHRRSTGRHR
jgi:DNA-binding beta-propeller fold protein YncE